MSSWKRLESKKDYKSALDRINALIDARRSNNEQNEFLLLSYLVEEYEENYSPIPDASPHEVVKFALEMKGLKQNDLIPLLGSKGNVSKILNGAARIQMDQLYPLSSFLEIPLDALIPKKELENKKQARSIFGSEMKLGISQVSEPKGQYKKITSKLQKVKSGVKRKGV